MIDWSEVFMNDIFWLNIDKPSYNLLSDEEKYQTFINWAYGARAKNPNAFDEITEWILDDSQWTDEKLEENKQILMKDLIGRFKLQNAQIRNYLEALKPSGIINQVIFEQLDRFDEALSGKPANKWLVEIVSAVFADFSIMKEHSVREQIAGNRTGAAGTDSVEIFGYINYLKDCDAGVQWAVFMPQVVENQQKGFKVKSFEYKKLPAMRFIGKECIEHNEKDMSFEVQVM